MAMHSYLLSSCENVESDINGDIFLFSQQYHLNPSMVTGRIYQYADGVSFTQRICSIDSDGINIISGAIGSFTGDAQVDLRSRLCYAEKIEAIYLYRGY
jgi:hypothetical protein